VTATLERAEQELIEAALPPDPLADIQVGDQVSLDQMVTTLDRNGLIVTNRSLERCYAAYHDIGSCQRAEHPAHWDHIIPEVGDSSGRVHWRWSTYHGEGFPELPAQVDDAGEEVNVEEITGLMRFRNRRGFGELRRPGPDPPAVPADQQGQAGRPQAG
jgi:hypothetical protein